LSKVESRRRAAVATSSVSIVTPTLKLAATTLRVRPARATSSARWLASKPVVPTTSAAPRSTASLAWRSVASGTPVKSITTWLDSRPAPTSPPISTPMAEPPATAPASSPSRGWPGASSAPTTRTAGSSRPRPTMSRPMRPAAPQTTIGATSDKVVLVQGLLEPLPVSGAHRGERQAELLGAHAHERDRGLHGDRVHLEAHGERAYQREQVVGQALRQGDVAGEERVGDRDDLARGHVGGDRDGPDAARRHEGGDGGVVSRVHREAGCGVRE